MAEPSFGQSGPRSSGQVTAWVRSSSKPELRLHVRLNGARIRLYLDLDSPRLQACTPSMALPMMDTHHHSSVLASLYVMADIAPNDHVLNLFAPPITFLEKRILRDGDRGIHVLCVNADCAPSKLPIRPVTTSPPIEQLVCAAGGIGAFRTNVQASFATWLVSFRVHSATCGLPSTGTLPHEYCQAGCARVHRLVCSLRMPRIDISGGRRSGTLRCDHCGFRIRPRLEGRHGSPR